MPNNKRQTVATKPNGTDADKPVVEVRQVAKPAWIPGMSEKDRLQAQNTNGEIMSKAALRNKQKRKERRLRHNHLELVLSPCFSWAMILLQQIARIISTQVDTRGPPPGFNKSQEDDEGSATVRNALKSLGFGLDGSMDSLISSGSQNAKNNNNNNSGGMQYSGLGYNLRL